MMAVVRESMDTNPAGEYRIRIAAGPLSGLEGTLLCIQPDGRAIVRVTAGNSEFLVELDPAMVAPSPCQSPTHPDGPEQRHFRR